MQTASKRTDPNRKKTQGATPLFHFDRVNYYIMAAGLVLIIMGYMLMAGGKSEDPNVFLSHEIFSFRRITLAPTVVLLGFVVEIIAIMRKPKS